MRKLLVSLLILVALLAALDRLALWGAEHDVAERLQADAHLKTAPSVQIHGFPFLTQLIGGDYDDVDITMHGLPAGSMRIDRLAVHLQGAHVSIGDVISQDRSRIHVDHASARLLLTYADLGDYVRAHVGVAPPVALTRSVVTGVAIPAVDTVLLKTSAGDLAVKLAGLPFGIRLTSAKTTQAGVEVTGTANGLTIRS